MRFVEKQFSVLTARLFTSINWLEIFTVLELFSDDLFKVEQLFSDLNITIIQRPLCMLAILNAKDSASVHVGQIVILKSASLFEAAPDH